MFCIALGIGGGRIAAAIIPQYIFAYCLYAKIPPAPQSPTRLIRRGTPLFPVNMKIPPASVMRLHGNFNPIVFECDNAAFIVSVACGTGTAFNFEARLPELFCQRIDRLFAPD